MEGVNFFDFLNTKVTIHGKDIFLNAMKTWDIPEENEQEKAARIELEDNFKKLIVLHTNAIDWANRITLDSRLFYDSDSKTFPNSARKIIGDKLLGLSLEFYSFFHSGYSIYFNELPDKKLTRLIAIKTRYRRAINENMFLLRTISGNPIKLNETWMKLKDDLNTKAKDLW